MYKPQNLFQVVQKILSNVLNTILIFAFFQPLDHLKSNKIGK